MANGRTNAGGGRRYEFDGTALPEDVLSGKTFFSDDPMEKRTGALPDLSGQNVAAAGGDISGGQYRLLAPAAAKYSGATRLQRPQASVAADIGLTAAKLVKGETVLGVAGSGTAILKAEVVSAGNITVTTANIGTAPPQPLKVDYLISGVPSNVVAIVKFSQHGNGQRMMSVRGGGNFYFGTTPSMHTVHTNPSWTGGKFKVGFTMAVSNSINTDSIFVYLYPQ